VDDTSIVALLREADASPDLPRLGGMARPDGVAIVSELVWCFSPAQGGATRLKEMPRVASWVSRIFLVRGLVKLASAIVPLIGRGSAASFRERLTIGAVLAAPLPIALVPGEFRAWVLGGLTLSLLGWMLRGRTLWLHGAEHRAIAAAESHSLVATWQGDDVPSRFSTRCGTNFAALMAPVSFLLDRLWVFPPAVLTPVVVPLVALMVTMEIWLATQATSSRGLRRLILFPGLLLQRATTREPTLAETRVALRAVAAVLAYHRDASSRREPAVRALRAT
jgi:hypothetical protein